MLYYIIIIYYISAIPILNTIYQIMTKLTDSKGRNVFKYHPSDIRYLC
jgi:hypothetical protein